jgi:HAMP domain-containing protein
MTELSYLLAAGLGVALVLQGVLLRRVHRRKLARQQVVLQRTQHALNSKLEKTKAQIGQLQGELSAVRSQLKRASKAGGAPVAAAEDAKRALERELDAAPPRRTLPVDGFADTQPAPGTQFGSLLLQ